MPLLPPSFADNVFLEPEINVIGHRGFGASSRSFIAECDSCFFLYIFLLFQAFISLFDRNTLLSFNTAHKFGVKYVEFDVHLTVCSPFTVVAIILQCCYASVTFSYFVVVFKISSRFFAFLERHDPCDLPRL